MLAVMLGAALAAHPATAQSGPPVVVWEQLPLFENRVSQIAYTVDWLVGDGTAGPALDTLVLFHTYGVFRYAPGEANGEWGAWRLLNRGASFGGVVTSQGTLLSLHSGTRRSTNAGRTWETVADGLPELMEVTLPWMREASDGRAVLISPNSTVTQHIVSYADGEAGSWSLTGPASAFVESLGEVPPSASLPLGRLLSNGEQVMYSDDGAATWTSAALGGQPAQSYLWFEFTFLAEEGHPYGGIVFATGCEYVQCDGQGETVDLYRSDDGGASYTFVHHFTAAEVSLPFIDGVAIKRGVPFAGPDGALWAGISRSQGSPNPGRIMRSTDEGVTWHRADAGLAEANGGRGWRIYQLKLARDGRMYAATDGGVWRTVEPVAVAAGDAPPGARSDLSIAVQPNPASGTVTVAVEAPEAVATARVNVHDATGRRVATLHAGPMAAGPHRFPVDVSAWAAGVYVVRATVGVREASARLVLAR